MKSLCNLFWSNGHDQGSETTSLGIHLLLPLALTMSYRALRKVAKSVGGISRNHFQRAHSWTSQQENCLLPLPWQRSCWPNGERAEKAAGSRNIWYTPRWCFFLGPLVSCSFKSVFHLPCMSEDTLHLGLLLITQEEKAWKEKTGDCEQLCSYSKVNFLY